MIAAHVWHRLGDWRAVTADTYRVLRPGAAFVLTDLLTPAIAGHRAPISVASRPILLELKVALTAAGFGLTRCTELAGLWYRILAHR